MNPPNRIHGLIPTAEIRNIDVKLGRGTHTRHVGNRKLTDAVKLHSMKWTASTIDGKDRIVRGIVSHLRSSGTRFLVRIPNLDFWHDISYEDAVFRTKQRFRDYKPDYAPAKIIGTGSSSSNNNRGLLHAESVSQELPVPQEPPLVESSVIGVERDEDEYGKDIRPDDRQKEGKLDCLLPHGITDNANVGKRTIAHCGKKRKSDRLCSGDDRISESSSDTKHPAAEESHESTFPEPNYHSDATELSDDDFARSLSRDPFLDYHYKQYSASSSPSDNTSGGGDLEGIFD